MSTKEFILKVSWVVLIAVSVHLENYGAATFQFLLLHIHLMKEVRR